MGLELHASFKDLFKRLEAELWRLRQDFVEGVLGKSNSYNSFLTVKYYYIPICFWCICMLVLET